MASDKGTNEKVGFLVAVEKPILVLSDENGVQVTLDYPNETDEFWAVMEDSYDNGHYLMYNPDTKKLIVGGASFA